MASGPNSSNANAQLLGSSCQVSPKTSLYSQRPVGTATSAVHPDSEERASAPASAARTAAAAGAPGAQRKNGTFGIAPPVAAPSISAPVAGRPPLGGQSGCQGRPFRVTVDGRLNVVVQTGPIATHAAGAGQGAKTVVGAVNEDVSGQTDLVISTGQIINQSDARSGRPACVVVGALGKVPGC